MRVFGDTARGAPRVAPLSVRFLAGAGLGAITVLLTVGPNPAQARHHAGFHMHARHGFHGVDPSRENESIVIDADTGRVLSELNADSITYPASLTKMMTLYLTFEALNSGRLRLDQSLPVSSEAASKSPTKLHLVPGDSVQVHELILGVVTKSANDAAAVLAEGLAGSEPAFADHMTAKARQLGMTSTIYRNASGLPDPEQRTTARDVAQLALALYHDFPREYRYFATREFFFRGRVILTHNHLLDWYEGADGIKTGYIGASGFNLAASAVRNGHRLIGVVMGGRSAGSRDREMAALLDDGFAEVGAGPTLVARREAPAPSAPPVVAETESDQPEPMRPREKIEQLAKAARKIAAHLSPVAKAEAAPIAHQLRPPAETDRWSIQLGAFRVESAAEQAARSAAVVPGARGKPVQIVQPSKGGKEHVYRARLLNFSPQEAQGACAALHKKKIECSVVPPASVKVAIR
ncbi:MAG: D-alanyl-D-alanine carboxypeptidase [Alphaproteobacteria bacterium]|nr:D-alanyl-D-alanine carboxypeptidase [Alphaproteobacteria bacterium]